MPWRCPARALATCLVGVIGCAGEVTDLPLPAPVSPVSVVPDSGLRAGFGRRDITPPPGAAINGYAFDGQQAAGYRHRIYARAMVLQRGHGERIAFVVVDLDNVSPILHRLTAARTLQRGTGIGADRLILSATHSHSGPGNYYDGWQYNQVASARPGYDPFLVDFLVEQFAQAVEAAVRDLRPARAAWGVRSVTNLTRNRSLDAFLRNDSALTTVTAVSRDTQALQAVDHAWTMLRVDQCDATGARCQPKGAFSVFAIHGTGNPPPNDLIDGDVHALVERGLERVIEDSNPTLGKAFRSQAFHLFANGAEGDVSPNLSASTRCKLIQFLPGRRPGGPRTPPAPEGWRAPAKAVRECLERGRDSLNRLGDRLTDEAVSLFNSIKPPLQPDMRISRAFETLDLTRAVGSYPLCPEPRSGLANVAGPPDGRSRLYGWKFLFFLPAGFEEGGHAIREDKEGCQGAKDPVLGVLQGMLVSHHGLAETAQFAVVKIGGVLVAAVPAEITTEAGMRIKRRIREADGTPGDTVVILGLSNGYLQYMTTPEEYEEQHYEGGSDLYGPNSAPFVGEELARLAQSIRRDSPIVVVPPLVAHPGPAVSYFPRRRAIPNPPAFERTVVEKSCARGALRVRWTDLDPGSLPLRDGPVLKILRLASGAGAPETRVAWDDDRAVEVRALGSHGGGAYLWEVRWVSSEVRAGRYRVTLTGWAPFRELSTEVNCP